MNHPWPRVTPAMAPYVLVLNAVPFIAGTGTIVAGFQDGRNRLRDTAVGICQILIPVIGWAWALYWGLAMHREAVRRSGLNRNAS